MSQETITKDLKVRLPVQYHMKLQTLKILKGKNMSDSLCEALDMYFSEKEQRGTLDSVDALMT